uniref:Uncharacterized protein n=1 Tax=Mustela putorius furo TaxID=9669 RepID=M3XWN1_MUSPF
VDGGRGGEGSLQGSGELRPWPCSHRKLPTGSSDGLRGDCGDPGLLREGSPVGESVDPP